jgi:serpin B
LFLHVNVVNSCAQPDDQLAISNARGVDPMKIRFALPSVLSVVLVVTVFESAQADGTDVVKGNNQFAFELYRQLGEQKGNLFLSPYSISTALAMTSAGASGKTAEEMAKVLHFPPQDKLHPALAALRYELNGGSSKKNYQLSTANALWGAKGYPFRSEFLKLVRDNYGADLTNLDFIRDAEGARRTINAWVEKETQDKIKDLIAPGILNADTRLVLTNAIYFKSNWVLPFKKKRTKDEPFHLSDNATTKASLMNQTARFGYAETGHFQALELPYGGKQLAMLVLLPKKDDLAGLEGKLTSGLMAGIVSQLKQQKVVVTLPRFKVTAQFELSDVLGKMGMPSAFRFSHDFSGLTTARERLRISAVIHKAFVDVNEEGTEAAAATAVGIEKQSAERNLKPLPVFRADHPFVYMIRDTRSGVVLFVGRLADPSKKAS